MTEEQNNMARHIAALSKAVKAAGEAGALEAGPLEEAGEALEQVAGASHRLGYLDREWASRMGLAEAELAKYKDLFDKAPAAYILTDAECAIKDVNTTAEDFLRARREFLLGKSLFDYVSKDDRAAVKEMAERLRQPSDATYESLKAQIRPRGGVLFPAAVTAAAGRDEDGEVTALRWLIHDIIELRRTEELLEIERDRAQKYLDVAEVMLVALNDKGEITMINRKGCRILGYAEGELLGESWFEKCLPECFREKVMAVYEKLMAGETEAVEYGENPVLTASGEVRIIAWHNTVLANEHGFVTGTLASGHDITEAERGRDKLAQVLDEMKATSGGGE